MEELPKTRNCRPSCTAREANACKQLSFRGLDAYTGNVARDKCPLKSTYNVNNKEMHWLTCTLGPLEVREG